MTLHKLFIALICINFTVLAGEVTAWGQEGHRIVGTGAVSLLDETATTALQEILGSLSDHSIGEACYWPDTVRKTPQWEWSAPLHYVNIPRSAWQYDRQRDCSDGMCVTAAIVKYANELTLSGLDLERRRQAFSWVCHLVGDLHQPLHAGYKDDLGGNSVDIEFEGKPHNLHQFWDRVVIHQQLGKGNSWNRPLTEPVWSTIPETWEPTVVVQWTNDSHALAANTAYPPGHVIEQAFADQSWVIIRQQWQKASLHLAEILNAVLGDGEVLREE